MLPKKHGPLTLWYILIIHSIKSVKLLTKSLQQEWKKISVDEIRKICAAAPNRLKAIAEKEGHHVE